MHEAITEYGLDAVLSYDRVPISRAIFGIEWHKNKHLYKQKTQRRYKMKEFYCVRVTVCVTCCYYMKKERKDKGKNLSQSTIFLSSYSNSSASSTASSMNWFTKCRVSTSIPIPIPSDANDEIIGWSGKRNWSARFHIPRQNRIMAEPTRNASRRLFQSSARVCRWRKIRRFIQNINYISMLTYFYFFCKK